jgi:KDO2-lipid IV(A) lauroyltransferase
VRRNLLLDYLVYLAVRLFICVVQATRIETGREMARGLAWLAADVFKLRGSVVDENLGHAFAELSEKERRQLTRRMWDHLFLLVLEVAHVPRKIHETNWRKFVKLEGVDQLVRMLLTDRPIIIVTGHFGNFEVGGYMLGMFGFPSHSVARTLDNPFLNDFVSRFRGGTGQYLIPKNGGYDQILDVLGARGTMAFLADQAAGPKGCWVDFFGRPASTYKAIALLALDHDAPIAVCYARRRDRPMSFEMVVNGIVDPRDEGGNVDSIRDLTQWYTERLEAGIRQNTEQYWWVHRRWKDNRRRRRKQPKKAA